jgi:hypothetical protein
MDSPRRASKRQKDRLDLTRICESHPRDHPSHSGWIYPGSGPTSRPEQTRQMTAADTHLFFATANFKDFEEFGFARVWNSLQKT